MKLTYDRRIAMRCHCSVKWDGCLLENERINATVLKDCNEKKSRQKKKPEMKPEVGVVARHLVRLQVRLVVSDKQHTLRIDVLDYHKHCI